MLNFIAILDKNNIPQNPTKNKGLIRKLLKDKKAIIFKREPLFTIKLLMDIPELLQPLQSLNLGIDCGYSNVGFSVINDNEEIIGGILKLRNDIKEKLKEKANYRNLRRQKLRYRKPRFDNRTRKEGWLPPSIQHKFDSHINLIRKIISILPISNIIIETAAFDIQKIRNNEISGIEYQQGEKYKFNGNNREYVLYRDRHKCQNPNCKNKSKNIVLQTHHIIYESMGGSDMSNNLITLCTNCHKSENHKKGKFLYNMCMNAKNGKLPKFKQFKGETFMSIINKRIIDDTIKTYPNIHIQNTYGYITKLKRIEDQKYFSEKLEKKQKIDKTHRSDAFYIAGGSLKTHKPSFFELEINIIRRNNRSLETFKDSIWVDKRTNEKIKGIELNNGRTCRNKNINTENLRKYRKKKIRSGLRSIRKERYDFQKGDLIKFNENWSNNNKSFIGQKNKLYKCMGSQNKGTRCTISNVDTYDKIKNVTVLTKKFQIIRKNKGFDYSINKYKTIKYNNL